MLTAMHAMIIFIIQFLFRAAIAVERD